MKYKDKHTIKHTPKTRGHHNIQAVSRLNILYDMLDAQLVLRMELLTHKKITFYYMFNAQPFPRPQCGIHPITPTALCKWRVIKIPFNRYSKIRQFPTTIPKMLRVSFTPFSQFAIFVGGHKLQ